MACIWGFHLASEIPSFDAVGEFSISRRNLPLLESDSIWTNIFCMFLKAPAWQIIGIMCEWTFIGMPIHMRHKFRSERIKHGYGMPIFPLLRSPSGGLPKPITYFPSRMRQLFWAETLNSPFQTCWNWNLRTIAREPDPRLRSMKSCTQYFAFSAGEIHEHLSTYRWQNMRARLRHIS